ncbi:MAG: SGNH/GDSL hydrolase family protein [Lachnospiraceae bacterium]|nr:SGNH/GDSL hydrolase family protein [Lachnospiraceae bacterium]
MKRKVVLVLCALLITMTSCGKASQDSTGCQCSCSGCSQCVQQTNQGIIIEDASQVLGLIPESQSAEDEVTESLVVETETAETVASETQMTQVELPTVEAVQEQTDVKDLTEGEKEARRQLIQQLAQQRELLYELPNSIDKMNQIAQIDTMIIENNVYDFSEKNFSFIGDSITEGVGGKSAEDGSKISYVNYVQEYLEIGEIMKHGMAGRMFADYGGAAYSMGKQKDNLLYPLSDATVIFLGVNDYLTGQQDKRYGEQNADSYSDAGYCGAVRATMKTIKNNFSNQDIFFVLVYDVDRAVESTYTDVSYSPSLEEFLDIQKTYANHFGFNIIDIYSTGVMDLTDAAIEATYTADGLHPNDSGYQLLAQHIAAELVLYYSNK